MGQVAEAISSVADGAVKQAESTQEASSEVDNLKNRSGVLQRLCQRDQPDDRGDEPDQFGGTRQREGSDRKITEDRREVEHVPCSDE